MTLGFRWVVMNPVSLSTAVSELVRRALPSWLRVGGTPDSGGSEWRSAVKSPKVWKLLQTVRDIFAHL